MKPILRRVKRIVLGYRSIGPLSRATLLVIRDLNSGPKGELLKVRPFFEESKSRPEDGPSPMRIYMDVALHQAIRRHCPTTGAQILDIGCGRGNYSKEFATEDVAGEYVGVDLTASPEWRALRGCRSDLLLSFLEMPVQNIRSVHRKFNFSFSLSALHYIENDVAALAAVYEQTTPGSYSVHCVPSLWSYYQFLHQGVRRYTVSSLGRAVEDAGFEILRIRKLGGAFSFILHWTWITVLETGLQIPSMRRQPRLLRLYSALLRVCLRIDQWAPFLESGYLVVARKPMGPST